MSNEPVDLPKTLGALLIGGLFASVLSGAVGVQVLVYFKLYPSDLFRLKFLVLSVLTFDFCHTALIWVSLWNYMIDHFGQTSRVDSVPWSIALSIVLTAIVTFFVHCFLAHRIHKLSQKQWLLTVPIVGLAVFRLASASLTAGELIKLHSFSTFRHDWSWIFTLGLALSTCIDVIITSSLFLLLRNSRTGAEGLNAVIDALIWYAFETGSFTCAGTVAAMICWLVSRNSLIFMGLHFVIGKLYANSLLVTLNARNQIKQQRSRPSPKTALPVHLLESYRRQGGLVRSPSSKEHGESESIKLEINVARSVQYDAY